jgi:hypothetical protein
MNSLKSSPGSSDLEIERENGLVKEAELLQFNSIE